MFASVEDQENSLVPEIGDQAGSCIVGTNRQPQHGGDGRRGQIGIAEHSKIDEQHGAREGLDEIVRDRDGKRRLADAADADDRDEARGSQSSRESANVVGTADHPGQAARQVGVRKIGRWCRMSIAATARPRDRRHEAIAAPGQRRDVSGAVLPIAERLAQAGHVKSQAAFFDGDVGPDSGEQIPLADDLVRAGRQNDEDVEASRPQFHRRAFSGEKSLAGD
jgi:hypothetical protein